MAIDVNFTESETPPSSADALNFRTRADAFVAYIAAFATKLIAFVLQLNNTEANINVKEASAVAASAAAVASANYKGIFVQGTSSALLGESWSYSGVFYKCNVNTSNNPVTEPASWSATSFEFLIHAATAKATPVDADEFGFWDSVSGVLRKLSFANLYATLKARFDLVYMNLLLLMTISTGVRQTIQFSSVDTNGLPNFAVAGALLSLDISASPSVPVKIHAAGGDTDRLVKLLTNMTISGLAANALNYCYFDVASDGTITGGSTVVPPEYINGIPNTAFPTWDSTTKGSGVDLTNGNLTATKNGTAWLNSTVYSTKKVKSGKFYAEVTVGATSAGYIQIGVSASNTYQNDAVGTGTLGYSYRNDANKVNAGVSAAYGATYTVGDIIGILYDAPTGQITFYKNNVSQGVAYTVAPHTAMYLAVSQYAVSNTCTTRYGATAFTYSLPAGASAWNEEILNGKFTFSISEMKAYAGDGITTQQAWRVFFAEAVTNATNVTGVVNYALNGMYESGYFALPANGVNTSKNNNLGTNFSVILNSYAVCKITEGGWAIGDIIPLQAYYNAGSFVEVYNPNATTSRNAQTLQTGNYGWTALIKSTGVAFRPLTIANWDAKVTAKRGW